MSSKIPQVKQLESLLENSLGKDIKILKHESRMLTAPGENYGSVMVAIDITIGENNNESRILHLVAKLCPANQFLCEIFNIQETFKKESKMYTDVIPCIAEFEKDYNAKKKMSNLFAKSFGARINLNDSSDKVDSDATLILENLKISGYDVGDRLIGFDKEHAALILSDLARFHAIPIAMRILKPEMFNNIVMPVLKNVKIGDGIGDDEQNKMISNLTDILMKNEKCIPFVKCVGASIKYCLDGRYRYNRSTKPFTTLVHSDYWVNNTMILEDNNGKPLKNKIVDLQLMIYHSIVYDLLFFIYSSIKPTIMYNNIDYFLKLYYDSFVECLEEFNIDLSKFSWEAFNKEISEVGPKEIGHLLIMFKPILTKRGAIDDMSNFDESNMYNSGDLSSDYEERVINSTLSFIERGWLQPEF